MKFKIRSRGIFDYHESSKVRLEKLGFTFIATDKIGSGPMFWWKKISEPEGLIELNSLEELISFTNEYGECIISDGELIINDEDRY